MAKVSLRQNIARSLVRYRRPTWRQIAVLYIRAWRLRRGDVPPLLTVPQRPERLVVTLTTIPARAKALAPVLHSLLDQTEPADRIILNVPPVSRRTGAPYPDPAGLNLPQGVDILRDADEGPATKFLGALRTEPEALIVVVDDDVIYPPDFLANLLAAHRARPDHAVALRGVRLVGGVAFPALDHVFCSAIAAPEPVDVVFGTWGYLLPPGLPVTDIADFGGYPEAVRWVDDVWMSGCLARLGVPRLVVPTDSFPIETGAASVQALTDGANRSGLNDAAAIAAFARYWEGGGGA
ncbi:MAG: glycosyltransferase family A protein [Roseovarius sp.]